MSNHKSQNSPLRVAAPYYGSLNHPSGGQSNLFFVLDVDPTVNRVANMHVTVWNPKDDCRLGNWLQTTGIDTFFCNSIESCHQQEILGSGIRVEALCGCDIISEIKNWLADAGAKLIRRTEQVPA